MNISGIGSSIFSYQPAKKTVGKPQTSAETIGAVGETDIISLSQDSFTLKSEGDSEKAAQTQKEADKQKELLAQKQAELDSLKKDLEASKKEIEAMQEAFDVLIKCLKISGNIISGNKVPPSDHRFLMENDSELYMLSISSIMPNDDPKKLDKVVENEKSDEEKIAEMLFKSPSSNEAPARNEAPTPENTVSSDSTNQK